MKKKTRTILVFKGSLSVLVLSLFCAVLCFVPEVGAQVSEPTEGVAVEKEPVDVESVADFVTMDMLATDSVPESTGGSCDPDDYASGTNISMGWPGVTLSRSSGDGQVYARASSYSSTGSNIFGTSSSSSSNVWCSSSYFQADFDVSVSTVSLDFIGDNSSDYGYLEAYNASGVRIDQDYTTNLQSQEVETLTVTSGAGDIAYIRASGLSGDCLQLDHLVYDGGGGQGTYVEDFETGDFSKFPWQRSGSGLWYITTSQEHSGVYSARAGSISHGQSTYLDVTLSCVGGDITFWLRVSSEHYYDYLRFYVDGVYKGGWSGSVGWTQVSYPVSAGTHTFRWRYSKDYSVSSGSDTAWIDDIEFPVASGCPSPTAVCTDAVCVLSNGTGTVLASDVDAGSTAGGQCSIASVDIKKTSGGTFGPSATFDCAEIGLQEVVLRVTQDDGQTSECVATVTVVDITPPEIACPDDLVLSADENCEAMVADLCAVAVISDDCTLAAQCEQSPVAGAMIPLGDTVVTLTATDEAGNASSCEVIITVADMTPPEIVCPPEPVLPADENCEAMVPDLCGEAVISDNCTGVPQCEQSPVAGTVIPLGDTVVTLTATDDAGNVSSCEVIVTVADMAPPIVTVGDLVMIWPANHKYHTLRLSDCVVTASDNCDGDLDVDIAGTIVGIYSDEPEDAQGKGDGSTADDIVIVDSSTFELRAERAGGGNGRVYGILFEVVDQAGNITSATCFVGVPHDRSGDPPVDDGAGAGYQIP